MTSDVHERVQVAARDRPLGMSSLTLYEDRIRVCTYCTLCGKTISNDSKVMEKR